MLPLKHYNVGIFIAVLNIFVYSIASLNIIAAVIFEFNLDAEKLELVSDPRDDFYLTIYKRLNLIFSLIMVITSINLLKGIIKKSVSSITIWLLLSCCVLIRQLLFLFDQVIFYLVYDYTVYSPLVLVGMCLIFGLQIICIRTILKFSLDLYRDKILQREQISFVKNSSPFTPQNYLKNLTQNDSSILTPLNEKELPKAYRNCNSVNLNKFEI